MVPLVRKQSRAVVHNRLELSSFTNTEGFDFLCEGCRLHA